MYGFDIYMSYAIGDWSIKGIIFNAQIVDVGGYLNDALFDGERLEQEMTKF